MTRTHLDRLALTAITVFCGGFVLASARHSVRLPLEGWEQEALQQFTVQSLSVPTAPFPKVTKALFARWQAPTPPPPVVVLPPTPPVPPPVDPAVAWKRALSAYRCLGFVGEGTRRQALLLKGDQLKSVTVEDRVESEFIVRGFSSRGVEIGVISDPAFRYEVVKP